jgi:cytochrome b involved in lipid metabolism
MIQIIVLSTLIAITIFRKEMSCNHCYSAPPTTQTKRTVRSNSSSSSATTTTTLLLHDEMDDLKTESLLEEAGCYGSGTYTLFLNTIRLLRRLFLFPSNNNTNFYCYYSHPFLLLHYHMWDSITLWWSVAAEERRLEDILDGADNWCVLGPQPASSLSLSTTSSSDNALQAKNSSSNSSSSNSNTMLSPDTSCLFPTCTASQHLPHDVLLHVFSLLHPQDIISFSCTNRNIHHILLSQPQPEEDHNDSDGETERNTNHEFSHAIWKALWYRDYGWLVTHWEIGQMALERSWSSRCRSRDGLVPTVTTATTASPDATMLLDTIVFTPKFYFRFGMSYVNYMIAGHCNRHHCYIGLGGHIYDITKFVDRHPGSSETLLVHSGRDVSSIFETMRHTVSARIMAEQFCVVVDTSLLPDGVGARPTRRLLRQVDTNTSDHSVSPVSTPAVSHRCHSNRPIPSTVEYMYDSFIEEQEIYERQGKILLNALSPDIVVGDIHVYYDPIIDEWKGWYMNTNFESVFIDL